LVHVDGKRGAIGKVNTGSVEDGFAVEVECAGWIAVRRVG